MIYFDNAATTLPKPKVVIDAVASAMSSMGNAGRGVNDVSLDAARTVFEARMKIAKLFGCDSPKQVVFTSNSTESLNMAIKGLLEKGDHVITTVAEHNSVLRPLYCMAEDGVDISFVMVNNGKIDYSSFEELINANTKMIICTHGSNLTGNLIDIKRVGEIARKHNLLFVVDASQTAGVFPIDIKEMNIDVLCFTGHKGLLGPQGTGGMVVREGLVIKPLKSGGTGVQTYNKKQPVEMPTALEAGTLNGHGIAGLSAAIDYINEKGMDNLRKTELDLMWRFYSGIKDIKDIHIYGDFTEKERCPIVALNLADYDSAELGDELYAEYGISTRSGAHCAPLMHEALGTVNQGAVRFSFSHMNTEVEVDAAILAIREIAEA